MLARKSMNQVKQSLSQMPVTAILGPRQCGKTTLVKMLQQIDKNLIYMDLERPDDRRALQDPLAFFDHFKDKKICLDEIQRVPELFQVMRSDVDERGINGRFLVLGSASPQLLKQSSETLAGRIRYIEQTPFTLDEITGSVDMDLVRMHWLRGGYPKSFLADNNDTSFEWRYDFIKTFLERDIPNLGFRVSGNNMHRFWVMLAHCNAQVLNRSKLGESIGISHHTVQHNIDILRDCYMVRVLEPLEVNTAKRLVKSPKVYIRDTGIFHSILNIQTQEQLFSHPSYGVSWESYAMENICSNEFVTRKWKQFFFSTHSSGEIDLILDNENVRIAVEFKASSAPEISRSFPGALQDAKIDHTWVVAPVNKSYPLTSKIMVGTIQDFLRFVESL